MDTIPLPDRPAARAEQEQRLASDPGVSAFVSAHAGAGKTKLLIDRLLRLMLSGADPAGILCLTYTKAAAAEMAIRLQRRLGAFVTMEDAALDEALKALALRPDAETRARARRLFADVLDLPGGMRISTIHAFCQGLLRRFPLEARISPHFDIVEDADAARELDAAREQAVAGAAPADVARVAPLVTEADFAELLKALDGKRPLLEAFAQVPPGARAAAFRRAAGAAVESRLAWLRAATAPANETALAAALRVIAAEGAEKVRARAEGMLARLARPAEARDQQWWEEWRQSWFRKDGEPCSDQTLVNTGLQKARPHLLPVCLTEQNRLIAAQEQFRAIEAAEASDALFNLAAPTLALYGAAKERRGLLGHDDLITVTRALLGGDGGAAWVKYKLDAAISHVLLDEVQDTAPAQWEIAGELTGDFFTGAGAVAEGEVPRSVFAVGDIKQSIYSFQGAEPQGFLAWRGRFGERVRQAGGTWRETALDVSFRSAPPVLRLVDTVFEDAVAAQGVAPPGTLHHTPNRAGQAGSVVLWPLAPRPDTEKPPSWTVPDENHQSEGAADALVRVLADWIAQATSGGMRLESAGRALRPGDVLVLVRRRNAFTRFLVRALKARGVPVAGLDRLVLTAQPAVADLLSLAEALLLPDDDLRLAEMLVSPLGGLTQESLMALAMGRPGSLRDALLARAGERPDWAAAAEFFTTLLARTDYAAPHALLAEALGPLGGRARLLARLGPEAAEPIDELLTAALGYAGSHPPSLQGFVHWLRRSGKEVKREAEAAGDVVRVMTVHGAKGLEAPLVILPDTVAPPKKDGHLLFPARASAGEAPFLWCPSKELACAPAARLQAEATTRAREEYNRLLYVALTRARDHLLVCGWPQQGDPAPHSWYALVAGAMGRAGAVAEPHEWGQALRLETPATAAPDSQDRPSAGVAARLPAWAGTAPAWRPAPPPPEPAVPRPLAPSRPEGVEFGPLPAARSPLSRRAVGLPPRSRGTLVHALLQHLPALPEAERAAAALRFCGDAGADAAAAALGVLGDPALAALFGPGSRAEQPVAGVVGGAVISGRIDRLAILPDQVLIADYKTGPAAPASAAAVPVRYLRQMAAYRALLARIYPGRAVTCILIWTDSGDALTLPPELLDRYAPLDTGAGPTNSPEQGAMTRA